MKNPYLYFKKKWTNYLDRLAKVNKDLYGNKRLDCCDLDHDQPHKYDSGTV